MTVPKMGNPNSDFNPNQFSEIKDALESIDFTARFNLPTDDTLTRLGYLIGIHTDSLIGDFDDPTLSDLPVRCWAFALRVTGVLELENAKYSLSYTSSSIKNDRLIKLTGISKRTWYRRMDEIKLLGEVGKIYLLTYNQGGKASDPDDPFKRDANVWFSNQPIRRMLDCYPANLKRALEYGDSLNHGLEHYYRKAAKATLDQETGEQSLMEFSMRRKIGDCRALTTQQSLKKCAEKMLRLVQGEDGREKRKRMASHALTIYTERFLAEAAKGKNLNVEDLSQHILTQQTILEELKKSSS